MNQTHILSPAGGGPGRSTAPLLSQLRKAFPLVQSGFTLGRIRGRQRLARLKKLGAPEVILKNEERIANDTLQVTVYAGEPIALQLDMTVRPGWIRVHHGPEGFEYVQQAAAALDYEIAEDDDELEDERQSAEEQRYHAGVATTRATVAEHLPSWEGARAIFVTDASVYLTRIHGLHCTAAQFSGTVEPVSQRCLRDMQGPYRFRWWWDEFSCSPTEWVRGPYVVEIFRFGDIVEAAVQYCNARDSDETLNRQQLLQAIRKK